MRSQNCVSRTRSQRSVRSSKNLDFDATAAGAQALAVLGDKESIPALRRALDRVASVPETARDVAWGLAVLGQPSGAEFLLGKLEYPDDLVRVTFFEAWLDVTGVSLGYAPNLPSEERLIGLAELRNWWTRSGGASALRSPRSIEAKGAQRAEIAKLVRDAGGNDMFPSDPEETEKAIARLIEIGKIANATIARRAQVASGIRGEAGGDPARPLREPRLRRARRAPRGEPRSAPHDGALGRAGAGESWGSARPSILAFARESIRHGGDGG